MTSLVTIIALPLRLWSSVRLLLRSGSLSRRVDLSGRDILLRLIPSNFLWAIANPMTRLTTMVALLGIPV